MCVNINSNRFYFFIRQLNVKYHDVPLDYSKSIKLEINLEGRLNYYRYYRKRFILMPWIRSKKSSLVCYCSLVEISIFDNGTTHFHYFNLLERIERMKYGHVKFHEGWPLLTIHFPVWHNKWIEKNKVDVICAKIKCKNQLSFIL